MTVGWTLDDRTALYKILECIARGSCMEQRGGGVLWYGRGGYKGEGLEESGGGTWFCKLVKYCTFGSGQQRGEKFRE